MAASPALALDMKRLAPVLVLLSCWPVVASAAFEVVIVEGIGGESQYAAQFADIVQKVEAAAISLTDRDRIRVFRADDASRDAVVAHFDDMAGRLEADDQLALFLIGHGSYDDYEYKFNIPGPDLTGDDLLGLLDKVATDQQLVVNTSSASGATMDLLKSDRRTLILATRSGAERHATRFGAYFAAALGDGSADLDKNAIVSAEEAFRFAERQVKDYFERNGQLATEHPRLEGARAGRFSLARLASSRPVVADARLRELSARRDALNADIDALRLKRESMPADAYQQALLSQMLELATVEDAIEVREAELDSE